MTYTTLNRVATAGYCVAAVGVLAPIAGLAAQNPPGWMHVALGATVGGFAVPVLCWVLSPGSDRGLDLRKRLRESADDLDAALVEDLEQTSAQQRHLADAGLVSRAEAAQRVYDRVAFAVKVRGVAGTRALRQEALRLAREVHPQFQATEALLQLDQARAQCGLKN